MRAALRPATETLFADLAQPRSGVGFVGMGEAEGGTRPCWGAPVNPESPVRAQEASPIELNRSSNSIHGFGSPLAQYSNCMLLWVGVISTPKSCL